MNERFKDLIRRLNEEPSTDHLHAEAAQAIQDLADIAPMCDRHFAPGGRRAVCLVCAGQSLQHALSRISYACEEENEMRLSTYDVFYEESAVVEQVQALRRRADADAAILDKLQARYRRETGNTEFDIRKM